MTTTELFNTAVKARQAYLKDSTGHSYLALRQAVQALCDKAEGAADYDEIWEHVADELGR